VPGSLEIVPDPLGTASSRRIDEMTETTPTAAPSGPADAPAPDGAALAYRAGVEFFLAPLVPLLADESISEIMVNGPDHVYVEKGGRIEESGVRFRDEDQLLAAANNIAQYVGKAISPEDPILDGRLPDGSRVCIVLAPVAAHGTSINIRRFLRRAVTPKFLLDRQAITPEALEFMLLAVEAELNVVVSGGTGSGKTTLLNILSTAFSDEQRIVVIEDTRELQIQKQHVVQMEARPADAYGRGQITVRDLFVTSLRMRPDRIVVGEVRRGEALDMVQAMTSGHRGSLATLHADTPSQACGRLETMCLLADIGLPLQALRRQIALALDLVVQAARLHDGRRLITHVSEIDLDEPTMTYQVHDIFNLDTSSGQPVLVWTGRKPKLAQEIGWRGLSGKVRETKAILLGS
jgi:pilus assembly protein CpaF